MNNLIFFFFYNLAHQSAFLDGLIVFLAVYFPYVTVFLAGLFLYQKYQGLPLVSIQVFFSGGFAWLLAELLKVLIHTSRPFVAFPNVVPLFSETGFAFPSGHATFFMALAVALYFCNKKIGYLFIAFALIIGFARIIAGVHFPIDILGGFILGALVAFCVKKARAVFTDKSSKTSFKTSVFEIIVV